jgi:hypothetical protein
MTQLAFNGHSTSINPAFNTWQELLADLESKHLGKDDVIASVHFDGSEVLNFRRNEALTVPLRSVHEVRVEAIGQAEMLRGAIQEADTYLATLKTSMLDVAELFRGERVDQANPRLQQLFEGIKMFVALLRGMELSLPAGSAGESTVEKALGKMGAVLEDQIKAQTAKDWMLLADILEYDFAPCLQTFEEILSGFKSQLGLNQSNAR